MNHRIMKITIDIPEEELREAIRHMDAKTKKDGVVQALKEFNRMQRLSKLTDILGTLKSIVIQEYLLRSPKLSLFGGSVIAILCVMRPFSINT